MQPHRVAALGLLIFAGGACGAKSSGVSGGGGGGGDSCELAALGLSKAHKVPLWTAPAACTPIGTPVPEGTVRTEPEFATRFTCTGGATSGIDFATDQLVIQERQLSPAGAGGEIVDDGTTVTYVAHFRNNCPDAPMPMPMPYTVMFLLPAGAARQNGNASCTVGPERKCR